MQATTTFKVGQQVEINGTYADGGCAGMRGVVTKPEDEFVEVKVAGESFEWLMLPSELTVAPKAQPSAADDLRLTPQAKTVLCHLKKRGRISPAEANTVYGISRLASCIHEIRNRAGYTVRTEQRRDDHGHKYAKYILAS